VIGIARLLPSLTLPLHPARHRPARRVTSPHVKSPDRVTAMIDAGNSTIHFEMIIHHAWTRVEIMIAKRNRRSREYGWSVPAYQSPDHLG